MDEVNIYGGHERKAVSRHQFGTAGNGEETEQCVNS